MDRLGGFDAHLGVLPPRVKGFLRDALHAFFVSEGESFAFGSARLLNHLDTGLCRCDVLDLRRGRGFLGEARLGSEERDGGRYYGDEGRPFS